MVFATLPPMNINRIMQIMLLCLVFMLLSSNCPWQKETGTTWQPERKRALKFSLSYYFQPLKRQTL